MPDYYPPTGDDVLQLFGSSFTPAQGDSVLLRFGDDLSCVVYYPPPGLSVDFQMEVDTEAYTYFKSVDIDMCDWRSGVEYYLIMGQVLDKAGNPISGVTVTGDNTIYRTQTGAGGYYALPVPRDSVQSVSVHHRQYSFQPLTQSVTIKASAVPYIDFVGTKDAWAIAGTVLDIHNQPVPDIMVEISGVYLHRDGGKTSFTTTNESGHYIFDANYSGDYALTPTTDTYEYTPSQRNLTIQGTDIHDQDFVAAQYYDVSGTITDSLSGDPVSGIWIMVDSSPTVQTDESGNYIVSIPDGKSARMEPQVEGAYSYLPAWQDLTIEKSGYTDIDFERYAGYYVITGDIIDGSSGEYPLFNVTMEVSGSLDAGIFTPEVPVGDRYFFVFEQLGDFNVTPTHPWYNFTPAGKEYLAINGPDFSGDYIAEYIPETAYPNGEMHIDILSQTNVVWKEPTTISLNFSDERWVETAELYLDDTLLQSFNIPAFDQSTWDGLSYTYQYAWDLTQFEEGFYTLKAVITNGGGNVTELTQPVYVFHAPESDRHTHTVTNGVVQPAIGLMDTGSGEYWEFHTHPLTLPPDEGVIIPTPGYYRREVNREWINYKERI